MFIKIYFFFLLINIGLTIVDGYNTEIGNTAVASSLVSVQTGSGVGQMPSFFNNTTPSGTLITNFTDTKNTTIVGHSGGGNFFDPITQTAERLYFVGELIFEVITGNFIINTMNAFTTSIGIDFPDQWNFGFQVLVGFINIFFIVYIVTSRSLSAFT